jgi:hypothetical protein
MNNYFTAPNSMPSLWGDLFFMLIAAFILTLVGLVLFFWVWMLIDSITRPNLPDRLVWVLLILFTHLLGSVIYYLIVKRRTELKEYTTTTPSGTTAAPPPRPGATTEPRRS